MTAGVQNIEAASYLPPPPSGSAPDAKGTGAAGRQTSDGPGEPQDFQSELALQQTGKGTEPAGQTGPTQTGPTKTGPGKPGKKLNERPEDTNLSAVTPVPVADPQKQILPFALALPQPQENAKLDAEATPGEHAQPNETPLDLAAQLPVPPQGSKSEDQSSTSANPSSSAETLRDALTLPATPPPPVAAAIQEKEDSPRSSPSALAFAARLSAVPQTTNEAVPDNPSKPPADAGSQMPVRVPVRYAATSQILRDDDIGPKQNPGSATERSARTDMVLPRIEAAGEAASNSGRAAPQQVVPTARLERVIEPPAAPPASAHDIRVRVPDNNGGSTQVRFVESGGEVRVSVRTADEALAQNLRGHLNDLTQRLTDAGIPAETWKPGSAASSSQNNQHQPDREGRGSGGQQSGGQGEQPDRQQKRPAWLEEMEASLHGPEN